VFRVEIFCEDKKLSYILWALTGHVLGDPKIQPVINAAMKNGKLQAETSGDHVVMFLNHLAKNQMPAFTPRTIRDWCIGIGLSGKSYSNVINKGLKANAWKRAPQKGTKYKFIYTVVKGKT
jgi:hypothetical protein